jgi:hypothetical protein
MVAGSCGGASLEVIREYEERLTTRPFMGGLYSIGMIRGGDILT